MRARLLSVALPLFFAVGADAGAATPLYRSVGINTGNLNTSSWTVTISGTSATFSGSMPDNVGVGDVLQYGEPVRLGR